MHDGNELIQFTYCYKTVAWLLFLERDLIVVVVVFFFIGKSWVEVILSETHDFSRAVDGLVKEIYLGMIFLQLQVCLVQPMSF